MIYLDNAATTQMLPEAVEAMTPYFRDFYGNASTLYELGQRSHAKLNRCRKSLGNLIGAGRDEIYFTSGGSESDNWALKGICDLWLSARRNSSSPENTSRPAGAADVPHIITTKIEHHAVLNTCGWLAEHGAEVTYLDVDEEGFVDPADIEAAILPNTALISVMMANNEAGTIEPVAEIGKIAHKRGIFFHTDAVQAFGQIPVNVDEMNIDLLSASSHKLYGPKGAGLLYIRRGILLPSLIHGGGQERGRRAGTENLPGIAGFAKAAEIAGEAMQERMERESRLRDLMVHLIFQQIKGVSLNGPAVSDDMAKSGKVFRPSGRLPGNVNIAFAGIDGEALLTLLDMDGVCASSGSACSSGSLDPSHVLLAMGRDHASARSSVRFSIGAYNTEEEIVKTVKILARDVEKLRQYT